MTRMQWLGFCTIGALIAPPSWGLHSGIHREGAPAALLAPKAAQKDGEYTRLAKKSKKRSKADAQEAASGANVSAATGAVEEEADADAPDAASPVTAVTTQTEKSAQTTTDDVAAPRVESELTAETKTASPAKNRFEAKGLDARVRRLTDALARSLKRLPGDIREQTFAVMPFQENGEDTTKNQLGLVVADLVVTNLARDHRLQLTERSQLNRIVQEQELGALGLIEPEQAAQIGVLAGATALVLGECLDLGQTFQVGARVVDADSGQVLAVEAMELPKAELIAFSANAVVLRSRSGAFFRSLVVPGWGQVYNREPEKAVLVGASVGALVLGSAGTALSAWITGRSYAAFGDDQRDAAVKKGLNPSDVVENLRESANFQYTLAASLAGGALVVWLGNAVEAYLSGVDVENLDAALANR